MTAFVDTNVFIRHLTGDPADQAARATAYLASEDALLVTDLIVAETAYVLESFYEAPRPQVAAALRSILSFPTVVTVEQSVLLRAVELYEVDRLDFAEAYLVACAESTGVARVASFDRALDRIPTIERIQPGPLLPKARQWRPDVVTRRRAAPSGRQSEDHRARPHVSMAVVDDGR